MYPSGQVHVFGAEQFPFSQEGEQMAENKEQHYHDYREPIDYWKIY